MVKSEWSVRLHFISVSPWPKPDASLWPHLRWASQFMHRMELSSRKTTIACLITARSAVIWIVSMMDSRRSSLVQQQKLWAGLTRGPTLIGGFTAPRRHHRAMATNHRTTWCKQSKNPPLVYSLQVVFTFLLYVFKFSCLLWKFF